MADSTNDSDHSGKLGFDISEPADIGDCKFSIDGWGNFRKFFMMDAFSLHEKKNKLFIQGFLNHKFTKSRSEPLFLLNRGLRQIDIANKLNVSRASISSVFSTMSKIGLISKKSNKFELNLMSRELIDKIQSLNRNLSN